MARSSKELIIKGKDEGIRFICKRHFHLSRVSPCKKCVKEIGEEMPEPLPLEDSKKFIDDVLSIFDGKVD